jgi:glutamine cyclotransferase
MSTAKDENTQNDLDRKRQRYLVIGAAVLLGIGAVLGIVLGILLPREDNDEASSPTSSPVVSPGTFELLDTVPHDPDAFTQGLELVPGNPLEYFESTGLYGQSSVRRVDLRTGQVLQQQDLTNRFFGEGLTYFDGKLIQITWQEQTAFVYNATNLDVLEILSYETTNSEGWGICYLQDNNIFLVTDGTQFLHTWDASTYELVDKVAVTTRYDENEEATPLQDLNELEWDIHSNTVLANVWQTDLIVRINSATGTVINQYDLSSLFRDPQANVLNGIAITDTPNEIWVTGKLWSSMYLIRLKGD